MKPAVSAHPRIHLTAERLAALKGDSKTTHAFHYGKLLEAADAFIATDMNRRIGSGVDNRVFGDILPVLSMAYLLAGDEKYLAASRSILSQLAALEKWGEDLDLVTGHFMCGAAIAYDWLHDALPPEERAAISAEIARHADILYRYASGQRVWWHDYFLHNWAHVITGGLACAAAALHGEHDDAEKWSDYAGAFFTEVEAALPEDGSYQEGLAYMTYATECIVRYFDLAKQLYGRDHFGAEWLRNVSYNILYSTTPDPKPADNAVVFGDGPRNFEWHGPAHMLYRLAAEYRDETVQGYTGYLVERGIGITRTGTWLNMLWYDPSLEAASHEALPTGRFFENLDTVFMRSGWDKDAMMVAFKCTNNAGRKTMRLYPGRDLGSGHAHPDAASFQIFALGEWLAIDPGYTHFKQSANHNTLLVNGTQQAGGERIWYDMMECFSHGPCSITNVALADRFDYARADAAGIYRPRAGLKRFIRHLVFLKPADLLIVDELEGEAESAFEWRLHADEEISGAGADFTVRKGAAKMAVHFLAPEALLAEVVRWPIEGSTHRAGITETVLLKALPASPVRQTTFATLLCVYRGEKPSTRVASFGLADGAASLVIDRGGRAEKVTLDLAANQVEMA